jgi:hypothetical protein
MNQRCSWAAGFPFNVCIDPFKKTPHFLQIALRNQLDAVAEADDLEFLSGDEKDYPSR